MRFPFAPDTLLFAPALILATLLFLAFDWNGGAVILIGLTAFVLYFFRDPERIPPPGDDLVVSPADGKVVFIDENYLSEDHPDGAVCVSIFLSIFNVHVQRCPLPGTVIRRSYNKGKFLAAWDHKASTDNEQALTVFSTPIGVVGVKQIAGLVARRIVPWLKVGDAVAKGDHLGLIRFGSRVDLILPAGTEVLVMIGDVVATGETVMARPSAKTEQG